MVAKVCPHCAVLSETDSDRCPACGRPYERRGSHRSAWIAAGAASLLVVGVAAFLVGRSDDDTSPARTVARAKASATATPDQERNAVTAGVARSLPLDSTVNGVRSRIGDPKPDPYPSEKPHAVRGTDCVYYNLAGEPGTDVRLCYRRGRLAAVTTVFPPEENEAG